MNSKLLTLTSGTYSFSRWMAVDHCNLWLFKSKLNLSQSFYCSKPGKTRYKQWYQTDNTCGKSIRMFK